VDDDILDSEIDADHRCHETCRNEEQVPATGSSQTISEVKWFTSNLPHQVSDLRRTIFRL
jgi:hypothetical protein